MRAHTEQQENKIQLDSPVGLPQSTSSDVNSVEVALLGISLNRCKPGSVSQSDCDRPVREIKNEKAHPDEALESMSVSQSGRARRYKGVGLHRCAVSSSSSLCSLSWPCMSLKEVHLPGDCVQQPITQFNLSSLQQFERYPHLSAMVTNLKPNRWGTS